MVFKYVDIVNPSNFLHRNCLWCSYLFDEEIKHSNLKKKKQKIKTLSVTEESAEA